MDMVLHDVYPSSNVAPGIIRDYGWEFIEFIPTITNESGRLAPTPERSDIHKCLRAELDERLVVEYVTETGNTLEITDFAIAQSPSTPSTLGFFALK